METLWETALLVNVRERLIETEAVGEGVSAAWEAGTTQSSAASSRAVTQQERLLNALILLIIFLSFFSRFLRRL
jgi:hypothetical protein